MEIYQILNYDVLFWKILRQIDAIPLIFKACPSKIAMPLHVKFFNIVRELNRLRAQEKRKQMTDWLRK
jgi:hypothetical protein